MSRSGAFLLAAALGAAAVVTLASCGSSAQLLPGRTARDISANLDAVKRLADEGDCVAAESAAQQVSEQIEALGGVDAKLKRALQEGAIRLNEVVAGCEETAGEALAPETVPTEPETAPEKPPKEKKEKKPKEEEATPETTTTAPPLPPQAKGKGKGLGKDEGGSEEEDSSGGIGPSTPAGGGG